MAFIKLGVQNKHNGVKKFLKMLPIKDWTCGGQKKHTDL